MNIENSTPSPEQNEQIKEVTFNSEGQNLSGKIFFPKNIKDKNSGVIFIHGWNGNQTSKEGYAKALSENGYISMTFDLCGHGKSEGDKNLVTMQNFIKDTIAAYDRLITEKYIDPSNITIVGNSIGSYLAACLTEQRNIKNIVLQTPIIYPDSDLGLPLIELTEGEKFKEIVDWRQKPLNPDSSASLKALHGFDGNVLIIESENDAFVPHQTIENYLGAVKNPVNVSSETIVGAGHKLDNEQKTEYLDIVLNWLKKLAI